MSLKIPRSLASHIKRAIGFRVALCTGLSLLLVFILTAYDIKISIRQWQFRINDQLRSLEDFTIGQMLLNNSGAITVKLNALNRLNNQFQVEWEPIPNVIKSSTFHWVPPFSWRYNYALGRLGEYQFGYFKVTGSILSDSVLIYDLVARLLILLFFLGLFFVLLRPVSQRIPQQLFIDPINRFLDMINSNKNMERQKDLPLELQELEKKIATVLDNAKQAERAKNFAYIAAKVAHDIRSPLFSLRSRLEKHWQFFEEEERLSIGRSMDHLTDILNNLDMETLQKEKRPVQIELIMDYVLSEKRLMFKHKNFDLKLHSTEDMSHYFIEASASDIQRMLSNLINNAIESIPGGQTGRIFVDLEKKENTLLLCITDNGIGIPTEKMAFIGKDNFTTKTQGKGIGISSAIELMKSLGGELDINSREGEGTALTLQFPLCEPPKWFADKIVLPDNAILFCIDDTPSIGEFWQERLKSEKIKVPFHYFSEAGDRLIDYFSSLEEKIRPYVFLVDYEFSGETYNGITIIEEYLLPFKRDGDSIYLITSHALKHELQVFCERYGVRLIHKFFMGRIPFQLS
jgi:signal transduction histidine kinase